MTSSRIPKIDYNTLGGNQITQFLIKQLIDLANKSGSGTVTSISVTTAHGVSATIANPTTTPVLTFTLTAITPSTVAATGNFACNGAPLAAPATGYGTPTGGSHQGSFAAGGISLANLAAAVAQLIIDLKATGLIAT